MTDWDLMLESIQRAMEAVEKAHEASDDLRENTSPETFDEFREQMAELTDHLTKLQTVLNNQGAFVADEMVDWLSKAFTGTECEYRRTPRMKI